MLTAAAAGSVAPPLGWTFPTAEEDAAAMMRENPTLERKKLEREELGQNGYDVL